jgi:hypothetical protein
LEKEKADIEHFIMLTRQSMKAKADELQEMKARAESEAGAKEVIREAPRESEIFGIILLFAAVRSFLHAYIT